MMELSSRCRLMLANGAAPVKHSTSCAIHPDGFDCAQLNSFLKDPLSSLESVRTHGRPIDEDCVADVWLGVQHAIRLELIRTNFAGFVRTIAKRAHSRLCGQKSPPDFDHEVDAVVDARAELSYRTVELNDAIDRARTKLHAAGISHVRVDSVMLRLLGWSPAEIAEAQGESVETVRKRVARSRSAVVEALRCQLAQEVA